MADPLSIGVRFALYANLMLLFGLPLFVGYTPGGRDARVASNRTLVPLALAGLMLSGLALVAMTASMAGVALIDVDPGAITSMITETPMGVAWIVRTVALALITVGLLAPLPPLGIASLAAVALGSLAWAGHGAAGEGDTGTVQLIADVVHLLSAGAWLGAIVGLFSLVWARRDAATTGAALENFASVGTIIVVFVVRRQNIWRNSWCRLAECGPRLGVDVKRRACGVASADMRWSVA